MLHLIHPALVHFSVAFLVFGGLCEAVGLLTDRDRPARFGSILVLIGTLSLLPTIVSGYLAANTLDLGEEGMRVLDAHERNAFVLFGVFLLAHLWKGWVGGRLDRTQGRLYAVLLLAGVLLTAYGALLGGEMVYRLGVGVGAG